MISDEILKKYDMKSLEEYEKDYGNSLDTEIGFYQTFLMQTDYIDNKLNEEYILGASKSALKEKYGEILELRKFAREQINRLESEL